MSGGFVAAVLGLGAFHGLNPAMGWLFAVALGLQATADPRGRRIAALRALPPIAAGHLVSVAAVAAVFAVTASAVTSRAVTIAAGAVLAGIGPVAAAVPAALPLGRHATVHMGARRSGRS